MRQLRDDGRLWPGDFGCCVSLGLCWSGIVRIAMGVEMIAGPVERNAGGMQSKNEDSAAVLTHVGSFLPMIAVMETDRGRAESLLAASRLQLRC